MNSKMVVVMLGPSLIVVDALIVSGVFSPLFLAGIRKRAKETLNLPELSGISLPSAKVAIPLTIQRGDSA